MSALPAPSPEALAHSARLTRHIADEISARGGWIPFSRYMELALYTPALGYYTAGSRKFGTAGDFVTAPEISPLFGQSLARQTAQVLAETGGDMLELGAGSGRLALDLLTELAEKNALPERYLILDVSTDLRERQHQLIQDAAPQLLDRVHWLEALPDRFSGVILANEVLDALPVHLLTWGASGVLERGVGICETGFTWSDRPIDATALSEAARTLAIDSTDYLSEISLAGPALIQSLADRLERGLLLFLDYGFPRAEYYHPQRNTGTLMGHYRHHALTDPFYLPGLMDLTAHVDFTAIADAALEAGLDVLGYASQAHFLMNCGLLQLLQQRDPETPDYLRHAAAVQKLLQPSEMGELFKVIAMGRGLDLPLIGFNRGDRRHNL